MFNLIPYSRNENNLFRFFDDFERSFFDSVSDNRHFRTDIADNGDAYELSAELPGFCKEDIAIDIDHDRLVISAKHEEDNEEKKDNYIRRERRFGSFSRSFDISGIRSEDIQASYNNGVLTLSLPKKQAQQLPPARRLEIQ